MQRRAFETERDLYPIFTQCKLTKVSQGKKYVTSTIPYQLLSIDFSVSGIISKETFRREDVLGLNGETGWILAHDVFSKIIHADTRLNKATPTKWLGQFLEQYKPACCKERFVLIDEGGELYGSEAA